MNEAHKTTENAPEGLLVATARAIGKVAGAVASSVGVHGTPAAAAETAKPGKLPAKNKSRVPRKEKKMQAKMAKAKAV